MTRHFALKLLTRFADRLSGEGDPKCRRCDGSGSYCVERSGYARCPCQDRIDEAAKLIPWADQPRRAARRRGLG